MNGQEIKAELEKRGYSIPILAQAIERNSNTVSNVIHRNNRSFYIAEKVAKVLGKPVLEVFDDVPQYEKQALKDVKVAELQNLLAS